MKEDDTERDEMDDVSDMEDEILQQMLDVIGIGISGIEAILCAGEAVDAELTLPDGTIYRWDGSHMTVREI